MRLYNMTNAFLRLETSNSVVLFDPWTTPGIYDGGWIPYPVPTDWTPYLSGVTHVFISHLHRDHFDLETIDRLNKSVLFIIPDMAFNAKMRSVLQARGFKNIVMLKPDESFRIDAETTLEVLPAMNAFAQSLEEYEGDSDIIVEGIDAGALVQCGDSKLVLLFDNSPYYPKALGTALERIKGADLMAFPFNGAAQDYPFCYDNLGFEEKKSLCNARESKRLELTLDFFRQTRPKNIMPFSSDFLVAGPKAVEFEELVREWWGTREGAAGKYSELTGINSVVLLPGERLEVEGKQLLRAGSADPQKPAIDVARENYRAIGMTTESYETNMTEDDVDNLMAGACANMFRNMDRRNLEADWLMRVEVVDREWSPFFLDFSKKTFAGRKAMSHSHTLTCRITAGYLVALLSRKQHWNEAMLSFQLSWERVPNEYNNSLFHALNFFHLPFPQKAATAEANPPISEAP